MKIKNLIWLIIGVVFLMTTNFVFGANTKDVKQDTINLPDAVYAQTNKCNTELDLCLGSNLDPANLSIFINNQPYTSEIKPCEEDTIYIYTLFTLYGFGKLGPYYLDKWEVNGQSYSGQFQDAKELIAMMNLWDPAGNWSYDENTFLIYGGVSGVIYSEMEITVLSLGGAKGYIGLNLGFSSTGAKLKLPTGIHSLIVNDSIANCSDTMLVNFACINPSIDLETIVFGFKDTFCIDTTELTGPIASIVNFCPDLSGKEVEFTLLSDNCIQYEGLKVGVDTFCVKVCDVNNICDTATLIVNVLPNANVNLTVINIFELEDSLYCFDTGYLPGDPVSISNVCPASSDSDVDFFVNSVDFCVFVTGLSVGSDTACYEICTSLGNCDTFVVIVNVKPLPKSDTIYIDVLEGKTIEYCLELDELNNNYNSIVNICPGSSGDNSLISIDTSTACMKIQGIKSPGKDTACYVLCNNLNICDTFIVIVDVLKGITPPKVIDITVEYNEIVTYCIDTTTLLGVPVSITNICPDLSGENADVAADPQSYCVYALGIAPGVDSACIVVCTSSGVCDTTIIIFHVIKNDPPKEIIIDVQEGSSLDYCIPSSEVCSPISTVQSFCPDKIFDNSLVTLNPNSICFNVLGIKSGGQDTLCLNICCDLGNCDTVYVIINVIPKPNKQVIDITVEEGESIEYCIDSNSVCTPIVSIMNICPGASGDNAQINFSDSSYCANIEGLIAGGADSLCLLFDCGSVSDTVTLIVHVVPASKLLVVDITIEEGETTEYCFNPSDVCSPIISITNLCPGAFGENAVIQVDKNTLCAQIEGVQATGVDSLCLAVNCGSSTDTLILIVHVVPAPENQAIDITIEAGDKIEYCFDLNTICAPILSVVNNCPDASGENAIIDLNPETLCADITGILPGDSDSLCLTVNCGNVSDTIIFIVHVIPHKSNKLVEVTVEKDEMITYCFSDAGICSPILTIENICENTVYDNAIVSFNEFTQCVDITGVNPVGTDTLCLVFCCNNSVCDTVTLLINVIEKQNPPTIINLTIDVTDTIEYCLDLTDLSTGVASITNICTQLSGAYTQSSFDTITNCFTFIGVQPYGQDIFCIVACDSTGFCDTTIIFVNVIPKIIKPETVELTVFEGSKITYCLDTTEIGASIVSINNLCPQSINDNVTYTYDSQTNCLEFFGFEAFGTDTACIVICGANGFCDTTTIIVHVVKNAYPDTLYFDVEEGGSLKYCFDPIQIGGEIESIINICPQQSGDNAAYFYVSTDTCVTIVGIQSGGPDTACFVVCNSTGFCDTIIMITNVYKADINIVYDTVLVNFNDTICFDISGFDPNTVTIVNTCPGLSGEFVNFVVNDTTACVIYSGLDIGTDTACITITDGNNNSLVTTIIVTVRPPTPDLIIDQIMVDSVKTYCLDLSELAGNLNLVTNICPEKNNGNISFTTDLLTGCITVTGIVEGTDTLCLVYCDDLGVCDTTTVIISVLTNEEFPIANDDSTSTNIDTPIDITVLGNDVNPGGVGTVTILPVSLGGVGPKNGTVIVNANGTITYIPDNGFCGVDSFTYLLCVGQNCDPAVVTITIICPDTLIIFNGITPNGDEKNDVFTIFGIQNYPNNKLSIYNRWGNRVYQKENYQNTWGGTWEDKLLPDGTYFYILDDGKGKTYSGYLVIYR